MYKYRKRNNNFLKAIGHILLMICISLVSIFVYDIFLNINLYSKKNSEYIIQSNSKSYKQKNEEKDSAEIVEESIKYIVGISKIKNPGDSIFLKDSALSLELGTGVIVSENGYILTNQHIVGGKNSYCYVTMSSGSTLNGVVKWVDKDLDLAIIKVNSSDFNYAKLGDSDILKEGEKIYTISNPFGIDFERSITSGVISSVNRTVKIADGDSFVYIDDLIKTNCNINNKNSGSVLLNSNGELIGIIFSKASENNNETYAIPINSIKPIIEKYINEGDFDEAFLGLFAYDNETLNYLIPYAKTSSGIYICNVIENSPCDLAGLRVGDIVTRIDDIELNKMSDLRRYIYTKNIGDEVNLNILRDNREYKINVKLDKKQ